MWHWKQFETQDEVPVDYFRAAWTALTFNHFFVWMFSCLLSPFIFPPQRDQLASQDVLMPKKRHLGILTSWPPCISEFWKVDHPVPLSLSQALPSGPEAAEYPNMEALADQVQQVINHYNIVRWAEHKYLFFFLSKKVVLLFFIFSLLTGVFKTVRIESASSSTEPETIKSHRDL